MPKFLPVHHEGTEVLINLAWIEEVLPTKVGGACIYMAFQTEGRIEQDFITTNEPYNLVRQMIFRRCPPYAD